MEKDPYAFDFFGIGDDVSERELHKSLIPHLWDFLIELGTGFASIGSEYYVAGILLFRSIGHKNPFITSAVQERGMDSFFIRPEQPGDIDAIFEVNYQAFGQDGEAQLVNALRNDGEYNPELSLVAVFGDRIIGHILFPPITIVSDTDETAALALAPLAVHQDFQCQGIGAALIEEGLRECRRLGHRIVVVVGHPAYYPRFGFTIARDLGIHAPFPCPDEAFMALPLTHGALDGIHGTVRYPPAFDTAGAHTS